MRVAAFIPARGGSKRVPRKNLAMVGDRTLLQRAIDCAHQGAPNAPVYVSTDDREIGDAAGAWGRGVRVHHRPAQIASDHAQIETAMAHWWVRLETKPDVVVLLQPTSPFRTAAHVRAAIDLLIGANLDSVVGVTVSHAPHFAGRLKPREGEPSGGGPQLWYEWQPFSPVVSAASRPRTQDLPPRGWENGSLYAFTAEHWERTGNRLGGRMGALPMTWIEGMDVDTVEDLEAARAIAERMGL
jgi:CMP-N,N'-diacetyllegionaminic acid synthase